MSALQKSKVTWKDVPTRTIAAGGVRFAYRELGADNPGTPLVCLIHLAAVLDNWDPRVIDGLATKHRVDMARGFLTGQDPKQFLFFTRTPEGIRAGKEFLQRLNERSADRDKKITVAALQAQLKALRRWGGKRPADLSKVQHPVLIANGDSDRMVPSKNTYDLAQRLPNSELIIYPDSGHGAVFQFHVDFVGKALEFLSR